MANKQVACVTYTIV